MIGWFLRDFHVMFSLSSRISIKKQAKMFRLFMISLVAGVLAGPMLLADAPKPFPQFEAKRVKPPKPGSVNRIYVFI